MAHVRCYVQGTDEYVSTCETARRLSFDQTSLGIDAISSFITKTVQMKRGLFVLLGLGLCQVKVLAPSTLALRFTSGDLRSPNGIIEGSTATFGAPTYGESLIGRLVYFPDSGDYCDDTPEYNVGCSLPPHRPR